MKKILNITGWILLMTVFMIACQEDEAQLGAPPVAQDADFTFSPSSSSENVIQFTAPSSASIKRWDFGNGQVAEGETATSTYIFAGEYDVTLTVYTSGGSISTTKTVKIENTDFSKFPPEFVLLTGGVDYPNGKTWVVDASRAGHMGVGPVDAVSPIWWAAPPFDKENAGLYNDKHTFRLNGFEFIQDTQGDVFVNKQQATKFPGGYENAGDYTAPYTAPTDLKWSYADNASGKFLTILNGGFIGYYTGVSTYQILSISENELFLRYTDAANADLGWFMRLIPEGFEPPPPAASTLPLDFEGAKPPFNGFGGTTFDVVANPSSGGINTSSKVAKYVKGFDGNWAGIETTLSGKLDFSENGLMKYKVYSPVTGKALFKIETTDQSADPIEVFANVTKVNQWEELTFDFSSAPGNTYNKIALFLDFDNNNGGTFYLDDIRQAPQTGLTLEALTGGSAKTWKLKPAAGSFGVGPSKGNDSWWPNGADISGERPCLFNDEFIFKTGNVYEFNSKGDIYGEGYMGLENGCTPESNLPDNAKAWGSGTHTFTFTPETDGNPATITVTGTGAFIALPKAKNGGEYTNPPPDANGSVTYEVMSYTKTPTAETLTITINFGPGYWTFVLVAQ